MKKQNRIDILNFHIKKREELFALSKAEFDEVYKFNLNDIVGKVNQVLVSPIVPLNLPDNITFSSGYNFF